MRQVLNCNQATNFRQLQCDKLSKSLYGLLRPIQCLIVKVSMNVEIMLTRHHLYIRAYRNYPL